MTISHEHDWHPVFGWSARYRCEDCKAFGYRRLVQKIYRDDRTKNAEIVPYKCHKKKCKGWAVAHDVVDPLWGKKKWCCKDHREEEQ